MKQKVYLLLLLIPFLLLGVVNVNAQMRVGGNAAPNGNAILDLNRNDNTNTKGLLLPRVNLVKTDNPSPLASFSGNEAGLYVYNLVTVNDVTPGVYYNDGTKWVKVVSSGSISISDLDQNFYNNFQLTIAKNFTTELGDTIISYISNNITQELTDAVMENMTVASADNTVTVTGSGTSDVDLSVNTTTVGENLINNNTFVTNLGDELVTNETFVTNLGDELVNNDQYITNLGDELVTNNEFVTNLGDELTTNNTFVTNLGDELISNNTYVTNLIDSLYEHLQDTNTLYSAGYGLTLDGTEFSADAAAISDSIVYYIVNNTTLGDEVLTFIGDNLNNTTINLGDEIANYITEHFSQTDLGDTIINYITNNFPTELTEEIINEIINNVTQELTESIMSNVSIASADNTVTVTGSGTSDVDLSVNITTVADSLVNNNTFVTNLGDELVTNETFVTNLGDELVSNDQYITNLGDELVTNNEFVTNLGDELTTNNTFVTNLGDELISNNTYVTNLIDSLYEYLQDTNTLYTAGYGLTLDGTEFSADAAAISDSVVYYIVNNTTLGDEVLTFIGDNLNNTTINLGDEIANYIAEHFSQTDLGDTIINYITNNFPTELTEEIINQIISNVTQELTDAIMANVSIASADNTVTVTGSGTSDVDLSVNITTVGESLINDNTFVTNLGDELVSNDQYITNLGDELVNNSTFVTNLGDELVSNDQYITNLGDELATNDQFITNLGDELISNNTYVTNLIDTLAQYLEDNNTLYSAGYGLTLDGTEFSADAAAIADSVVYYIVNNTTLGDEVLTFIGDNLNNTTINLGDEIANYIAEHFSQTDLGDTIINYITNNFPTELTEEIINQIISNVTQELTDAIMANVSIASADNTVTVTGSGTSDVDLSVNITTVGENLVNDNTFVTNLGDELISNDQYITNLGDELVDNTQFITNLGDELVSNDQYITNLGDELVTNDQFITNLGDELISNNTYVTNLIDTLAQYLEDNNTLYSAGYGLTLDGTEFSADAAAIADSVVYYIVNNTTLGDEILTFIGDNLDNSTINLGDEIANYIAEHFSETDLGDTIINYITNNFPTELTEEIINQIISNVTQELTDAIMANVSIASADNTVTVTGSGTSDVDLSVNITTVGESLVNDNTFVTNLGDELVNNNTFVTNLGDEIVENLDYVSIGDNLALNIDNTSLKDTIINIVGSLGGGTVTSVTTNIAGFTFTTGAAPVLQLNGGQAGTYLDGTGNWSAPSDMLPTASAVGQVLKWDGSAWVAGTDENTDTNTFPAVSSTTGLIITGSGTNIQTVNLPSGANGQVLKSNGTTWIADTDANTTYTGSASVELNGTSFERAALTGDVTAAANSNETTIANNAITTAKIAANAVSVDKLPFGAASGKYLDGDGSWKTLPTSAEGSMTKVGGDYGITVTKEGTDSVTVKLPVGTAEGDVLKWNATTQEWVPGTAAAVTKKIVSVKTASYTVQANDDVIITENSASVAITFPTLTAAENGKTVYVMNNNTGGTSNTFSSNVLGVGTTMTILRGAVFIWDATGNRWVSFSK